MDQAKFNERRRIFDDAIHLRKPERVPTLSNVFTWKIFDTDITPRPTIEEATNDWTLMERITREHIERYQFDGYYDLGDRNNSGYQKIFGYKLMHIIKGDTINALDPQPLEIEELIPYAKDVDMYTWTHLMPMRFGKITYGQLNDALESMLAYGEFVQKMPAFSS